MRKIKALCLFILTATLLSVVSCSKDDGKSSSSTPQTEKPEAKPIINVTTPNITLGQEGGSATVSFTSNANWKASTSAGWISVTPSSGAAGTISLTVTANENDSYDERNASITVSSGSTSQQITVSQKQKDALTVTSNKVEVPFDGGEAKIEVKANVDYTVTVDDACKEWVEIQSTRALVTSDILLNISPNESKENRIGKVTVSSGDINEEVSIYQEGAQASIILTQKEYTVGSAGETLKVELKSNTDYIVEMPKVDWISESKTRAVSAYTHYFVVAENTSYGSRTAEIAFVDKENGVRETVTVTQLQKDAIIVSQKEIAMGEDGGDVTVLVSSNIGYEISTDVDWIRKIETRALTEKSHQFSIDPLPTDVDTRSGTITFADPELGISDKVTVTQTVGLTLEETELTLMPGDTYGLHLDHVSGKPISWSSSDNAIATVDQDGRVSAKRKGNATITASNGSKEVECVVYVKEITDLVVAMSTGGVIMMVNDKIQSGSILGWSVINNSTKDIEVLSLQLIDGVDHSKTNVLPLNKVVEAKSNESWSTTINKGINAPIAYFIYKFDNVKYYVQAQYGTHETATGVVNESDEPDDSGTGGTASGGTGNNEGGNTGGNSGGSSDGGSSGSTGGQEGGQTGGTSGNTGSGTGGNTGSGGSTAGTAESGLQNGSSIVLPVISLK